MARTVQCIKLGKEAEGLDFPPYPGELGQRIWANVSKQAWAGWLKHQTMLVNENRLNLADARARQYLARQMENHFFGSGADAAAGYGPPRTERRGAGVRASTGDARWKTIFLAVAQTVRRATSRPARSAVGRGEKWCGPEPFFPARNDMGRSAVKCRIFCMVAVCLRPGPGCRNGAFWRPGSALA